MKITTKLGFTSTEYGVEDQKLRVGIEQDHKSARETKIGFITNHKLLKSRKIGFTTTWYEVENQNSGWRIKGV